MTTPAPCPACLFVVTPGGRVCHGCAQSDRVPLTARRLADLGHAGLGSVANAGRGRVTGPLDQRLRR